MVKPGAESGQAPVQRVVKPLCREWSSPCVESGQRLCTGSGQAPVQRVVKDFVQRVVKDFVQRVVKPLYREWSSPCTESGQNPILDSRGHITRFKMSPASVLDTTHTPTSLVVLVVMATAHVGALELDEPMGFLNKIPRETTPCGAQGILRTRLISACKKPSLSCANRCGTKLSEYGQALTGAACACDSVCQVYGDCCWDFLSLCRVPATTYNLTYSSIVGQPRAACVRGQMLIVGTDTIDGEPESSPYDHRQAIATYKNYPEIHFLNMEVLRKFFPHTDNPGMVTLWNKTIKMTGEISFNHLTEFFVEGKIKRNMTGFVKDVAPPQMAQRQCMPHIIITCEYNTSCNTYLRNNFSPFIHFNVCTEINYIVLQTLDQVSDLTTTAESTTAADELTTTLTPAPSTTFSFSASSPAQKVDIIILSTEASIASFGFSTTCSMKPVQEEEDPFDGTIPSVSMSFSSSASGAYEIQDFHSENELFTGLVFTSKGNNPHVPQLMIKCAAGYVPDDGSIRCLSPAALSIFVIADSEKDMFTSSRLIMDVLESLFLADAFTLDMNFKINLEPVNYGPRMAISLQTTVGFVHYGMTYDGRRVPMTEQMVKTLPTQVWSHINSLVVCLEVPGYASLYSADKRICDHIMQESERRFLAHHFFFTKNSDSRFTLQVNTDLFSVVYTLDEFNHSSTLRSGFWPGQILLVSIAMLSRLFCFLF